MKKVIILNAKGDLTMGGYADVSVNTDAGAGCGITFNNDGSYSTSNNGPSVLGGYWVDVGAVTTDNPNIGNNYTISWTLGSNSVIGAGAFFPISGGSSGSVNGEIFSVNAWGSAGPPSDGDGTTNAEWNVTITQIGQPSNTVTFLISLDSSCTNCIV